MVQTQPNHEQHPPLEQLKELSLRVRDVIRGVVQYEPGLRPAEVGRRFGVNKDVSSRVVACCQIEDELEFAYRCPSPPTLRRIIDAAREQGSALAMPAARTVDEFEQYVRSEFGDQSAMNVLIGSVHPDLSAKAEAVQKQSVFRGMSQLHGLVLDTSLEVAVIAKSEKPGHIHYLWADGGIGLRWLRLGPPLVVGAWHVNHETGALRAAHQGRPITDDWGGALGLEKAPGGSPWVRPRIATTDTTVQVLMEPEAIGTRHAVSYGVMQHIPDPIPIGRTPSLKWFGVGQLVAAPSKLLVFDLLVEEGLFDDAAPELLMYNTAMRGTSALYDPTREFDRLRLHERIDALPPGPDGHRSTDAPFVPDLVRYLLKSTELEGRRFRGYRLRQSYPIYGSQVTFVFPRM